MEIRLEPHDEFTHEVPDDATYNESVYANVIDPESEVGAFFRVGNRPNERYAEVTTCLYLPDGRVGFMFQRPEIHDNRAFDAGGLRIEVTEPFTSVEVEWSGKVVVLDDPLQMADPKRAFTENPWVPSSASIAYCGTGAMFGGERMDHREREGEEFAKAHFEQLVAGAGSITVGDETWPIDGYGLRDHSWGPRTWQGPWYYRWLTANFDDDFGFMASRVARAEGPGTRGGFVWEDGRLTLCHHLDLATEWTDDRYHRSITATLGAPDGRWWSFTGEVRSLVPLRNRREGAVTRISEGLTRWTMQDGRVGFGLSEYLDQIVDGAPVGIDE